MRILTVRQPWAWAIIHGQKDVENRVRNIAGDYRGPVAIHVAREIDTQAMTQPTEALRDAAALHARRHPDPLDGGPWFNNRGAIIGVVNLVDVHRSEDCYHASVKRAAALFKADRDAFYALPLTSGAGGLIGRASHCSSWAQDDAHHLVLANPRPLASPIPYKGALGLHRLDDDTVTRVLEQIGDHHA